MKHHETRIELNFLPLVIRVGLIPSVHTGPSGSADRRAVVALAQQRHALLENFSECTQPLIFERGDNADPN